MELQVSEGVILLYKKLTRRSHQNGVTDKPCYEVLFGVSYMANRSMLLRANHLLGLNGGVNRVAWVRRAN